MPDTMTPRYSPLVPPDMLEEIFWKDGREPQDERLWVPNGPGRWNRPLCFNVSQGYWVHLGKVTQGGIVSRHRHPAPVHGFVLEGRWRYLERDWIATLIAVQSGANMNFDRLRHVAERGDLGAQREALLAVEIPEQPGSFLRFCEVLGSRNVTEFNYRYESAERAQIFVGFALSHGKEEREAVLRSLAEAGYPVLDMTDNEMAKLHVRYMVGGHARGIANELLFRFEFPERPGALLKFLRAVGSRWNISLFHYRNHGSDYGRVLAGIQVPAKERAELVTHLEDLRYAYVEETSNPAMTSTTDMTMSRRPAGGASDHERPCDQHARRVARHRGVEAPRHSPSPSSLHRLQGACRQ